MSLMLHRSRRSRQTKAPTPLLRFVVALLLLRILTGNLLGILLYNETKQVVQQIELMEFGPSGSYMATCDQNNPLIIRPLTYKI